MYTVSSIIILRGHATNSYGFTSKILDFNVLSLLLTYFCIRCICGTQKSPSPFRNTDVKAYFSVFGLTKVWK